jgi:FkbM family methyltransferase
MINNMLNFFIENILLKIQNKRIIKALPKSFDTVVDIGAHTGELHSCFVDNDINFKKYLMFEPNKNSYEKLCKIKDKRISKFNFAISSRNSKKKFLLNPLEMTSSFSEINENLFKFRVKALLFKGSPDIKNNELVQTKKLDDFEIKPGNNFLKIDTEGHELEVLKGTVGYLEKKIFNYIILEIQKPNTYKNYDPNSIYALLNKYSYHKVKEFNVPLFGFSDVLFIKK